MASRTATQNGAEVHHDGRPRNYRAACLLLLVAESPAHGYDLIERVGELGIPCSDPGSIYRALRDLEQAGLVVSCWDTSSAGPARRTYRLTEAGADRLDAWASAVGQSQRFLCAYLARHQRLSQAGDPEIVRYWR